MKKRIIILLVAIASLILMSACSNETAEASLNLKTTLATEVVENVPETTENPNIIEFNEPVVVLDNEYFKMELIRIWQKESGRHLGEDGFGMRFDESPSWGMDFKFYNKSDREFSIYPDLYLGSESVRHIIDHAWLIPPAPAPGKSTVFQTTIILWDGMKELPLELEELKTLNGTIDLGRVVPGIDASFAFSIADALALAGY